MKVGDLVRIKRGDCKGKLALIVKISKRNPHVAHCSHPWSPYQDRYGWYAQDLEVLNESR